MIQTDIDINSMELRDEIADIIFESDHRELQYMECCTQLAIKILGLIKTKYGPNL